MTNTKKFLETVNSRFVEHNGAVDPHPREDVKKLVSALEIAMHALEKLRQHNGGCDGPLGCMCSAPKAREAELTIEELFK